jgi:hypothetical protein
MTNDTPATRTLAVLQPSYLPWLGYFDQMNRVDDFVFYDDVQFDKHGWRNRNRVKGPTGEPVWLTVPVLHKGLGFQPINEIRINNDTQWGRKQVATLRQSYARAPYLDRYLPQLETLLMQKWDRLVDLDLAMTRQLAAWLGIDCTMTCSSELGITGERSERLLLICQRFGATRYLSGNAAQVYLDVDLFSRNGIEVSWQNYEHPVYPQLHGPFVSHLSVIDLLFNCGEEESGAILDGATKRNE